MSKFERPEYRLTKEMLSAFTLSAEEKAQVLLRVGDDGVALGQFGGARAMYAAYTAATGIDVTDARFAFHAAKFFDAGEIYLARRAFEAIGEEALWRILFEVASDDTLVDVRDFKLLGRFLYVTSYLTHEPRRIARHIETGLPEFLAGKFLKDLDEGWLSGVALSRVRECYHEFLDSCRPVRSTDWDDDLMSRLEEELLRFDDEPYDDDLEEPEDQWEQYCW